MTTVWLVFRDLSGCLASPAAGDLAKLDRRRFDVSVDAVQQRAGHCA